MKDYSWLPKPFFALAPMEDVTDTVFRHIVQSCAPPDISFTEFVNVDGLQSPGRTKLLKKLRFSESEGPLVAQLWGLDPDNFQKVAKEIADGSLASELGLPPGVNFVGIDLNMGCPAKSEVKNGTCSALIKNRPLAAEIIDATKRGLEGRLPLSVKTRVGFAEVDMTWIDFLLQQELAMLIVHGRTRQQMSKIPADWQLIAQAREQRDRLKLSTLIVGNGDVQDRLQALELATRHKLDGIMIGRGVFHDPYAFAKISPWAELTPKQKLKLYERHVQLFSQTWQHAERPIHTLNKFCKIYVNGFTGAKELREQLMQANSTDELLNMVSRAIKNPGALTGIVVA